MSDQGECRARHPSRSLLLLDAAIIHTHTDSHTHTHTHTPPVPRMSHTHWVACANLRLMDPFRLEPGMTAIVGFRNPDAARLDSPRPMHPTCRAAANMVLTFPCCLFRTLLVKFADESRRNRTNDRRIETVLDSELRGTDTAYVLSHGSDG